MRKVSVLVVEKLLRLLQGDGVVRVVNREGEDLQLVRFVLLREIDNRGKELKAAPAPARPNIDDQQTTLVCLNDRGPLFGR